MCLGMKKSLYVKNQQLESDVTFQQLSKNVN